MEEKSTGSFAHSIEEQRVLVFVSGVKDWLTYRESTLSKEGRKTRLRIDDRCPLE